MHDNKNLVTIQEAKAVTSSLQISQTFSKEHRHVLESIRNLVAENSAANNYFIESEYENRGKWYPMYIINRDGFTLLAMGFTGKRALQFKIDYINAFNRMEEYIKNQSTMPTLPKRKATGKRVETYLPNYDVLRLQTAAYNHGYGSVYNLMQKLIYDFLEGYTPAYITQLQDEIKHLKWTKDQWQEMWQERNQFVGDILPFIQEMNRTIDKERTLRKKYEAKLKQIKLLA